MGAAPWTVEGLTAVDMAAEGMFAQGLTVEGDEMGAVRLLVELKFSPAAVHTEPPQAVPLHLGIRLLVSLLQVLNVFVLVPAFLFRPLAVVVSVVSCGEGLTGECMGHGVDLLAENGMAAEAGEKPDV